MSGRFSIQAIFSAVNRFSQPLAKMDSDLMRATRRMSRGLKSVDSALGGVHRGLVVGAKAAGAGMAAAGAGVAAVALPALKVEEAISKVSTVITPFAASMQDALAQTKASAVAWSRSHVQSIEEYLDASYNMSSAGLNHVQAIAGTEAALTLATATMGEAATAGNLLATVYNNMGNKGADAEAEMKRLGSVLARTQALFQIADLSMLNEGLKLGAPAAIQYGVSVEQLSAAIGALNTAGLQGSMAGTAFSASMRNINKASKALRFEVAKTADGGVDFAATLGNIATKYGSFDKMTDKTKAKFQKAFGDEGLRAISLLLGKTDEFNKQVMKVTDSLGAAESAQSKIESARMNALRIRTNQFRATFLSLGDALLPVIDQLAPEFDKVVGSLNVWIDANKELIASGVKEFFSDLVANLPIVVERVKQIGKAVAVFYAVGAAVKVARVAVEAFRVGTAIATGVHLVYTKVLERQAAKTLAAGAASTAAGAQMELFGAQTAATSGVLAGLRGSLNASALGTAVNGVQSKLGKAGLLGAALGVGYAIGSWINNLTGFSEKASTFLANFFDAGDNGYQTQLAAAGGRATSRGLHFEPTPGSAAVVTPSPSERIAHSVSETTSTEKQQVEITVRGDTDRVDVKSRGSKRAGVRHEPSGKF